MPWKTFLKPPVFFYEDRRRYLVFYIYIYSFYEQSLRNFFFLLLFNELRNFEIIISKLYRYQWRHASPSSLLFYFENKFISATRKSISMKVRYNKTFYPFRSYSVAASRALKTGIATITSIVHRATLAREKRAACLLAVVNENQM